MNRPRSLCLLVAAFLLLAGITVTAQQTAVWKVIDTVDMQYFGNGQYHQVIDGFGDDDYVVIGTLNRVPLPRLVRRTTDGGNSWMQLKRDTVYGESWGSVAHPSANMIVVIGDTIQTLLVDSSFNVHNRYRGMMLLSTDGGATWTRRLLDTNTRLRQIAMCNDQHGVISQMSVGNMNNTAPSSYPDSLLRTTDGWKTWNVVALPPDVRLTSQLICPAPDVYIAKAYHTTLLTTFVFKTSDGGATWERSATLPGGHGRMTFLDAQNGWSAGGVSSGVGDRMKDVITRSTDGGMTWTTVIDQEIGDEYGMFPFGLMDIDFADAQNGIAVGRADKILRTRDGGLTWVQEFPPASIMLPFPIRSIIYPSPGRAIAVYNGATIIRYNGEQSLIPPAFVKPGSAGPHEVNGITVEWTPITGATQYHLQIAPQPIEQGTYDPNIYDQSIIDTLISGTSIVLNDLQYHHRYYARIKSVNASSPSDWHERAALFYTKKTMTTVAPPQVLIPERGASNQPTTLTITWQGVSGAQSYDLQLAGDRFFLTPIVVDEVQIPSTSKQVSGLAPNTEYYIRVRARLAPAPASTEWSSTVMPHMFTTGAQAGVGGGSAGDDAVAITLFPNPVTHAATVEVHGNLQAGDARLTIHNMPGAVVRSIPVAESGPVRFDVAGLPAGTYYVRLISGGRSLVAPFVVVR